MSEICPGCRLSIDVIKIFERSPKTGKEWLISRCPRERCSYNLDIEAAPIRRKTDPENGTSYFWNGKHWE